MQTIAERLKSTLAHDVTGENIALDTVLSEVLNIRGLDEYLAHLEQLGAMDHTQRTLYESAVDSIRRLILRHKDLYIENKIKVAKTATGLSP